MDTFRDRVRARLPEWYLQALVVAALGAALLLFPLATQGEKSREMTVSAAASLKDGFERLGKGFEAKNKGVRIYFNFAGSGELMRQIAGGAPVDVFASAAARETDELDRKGFILSVTRQPFASNSLVLVKGASSGVALGSFSDLKKNEIKRVCIGNPATVPAGMYAEQVLRYFNVWDDVKARLVFGESVRQVLDYTARGEVDAGIVFATDARARAKEISILAFAPERSHQAAIYHIAVVKGTKEPDLARAFVQFVLSVEGEKILTEYGFRPKPVLHPPEPSKSGRLRAM